MAVSLAAAGLSLATPAMAQDEEVASDFTVSANVALTTDYRFRGVSLSGGDPALQGGFDVSHSSGFYVGTWGQFDLGRSGLWRSRARHLRRLERPADRRCVSVDVGVLYYIYPTESLGLDTDYIEPYASITAGIGPAEATFGVAYAPKQDSLGDDDNLYLYTDLGFGIPDTPFTLTAHLGYTDGALAPPLLAGTGDDSGLGLVDRR